MSRWKPYVESDDQVEMLVHQERNARRTFLWPLCRHPGIKSPQFSEGESSSLDEARCNLPSSVLDGGDVDPLFELMGLWVFRGRTRDFKSRTRARVNPWESRKRQTMRNRLLRIRRISKTPKTVHGKAIKRSWRSRHERSRQIADLISEIASVDRS